MGPYGGVSEPQPGSLYIKLLEAQLNPNDDIHFLPLSGTHGATKVQLCRVDLSGCVREFTHESTLVLQERQSDYLT